MFNMLELFSALPPLSSLLVRRIFNSLPSSSQVFLFRDDLPPSQVRCLAVVQPNSLSARWYHFVAAFMRVAAVNSKQYYASAPQLTLPQGTALDRLQRQVITPHLATLASGHSHKLFSVHAPNKLGFIGRILVERRSNGTGKRVLFQKTCDDDHFRVCMWSSHPDQSEMGAIVPVHLGSVIEISESDHFVFFTRPQNLIQNPTDLKKRLRELEDEPCSSQPKRGRFALDYRQKVVRGTKRARDMDQEPCFVQSKRARSHVLRISWSSELVDAPFSAQRKRIRLTSSSASIPFQPAPPHSPLREAPLVIQPSSLRDPPRARLRQVGNRNIQARACPSRAPKTHSPVHAAPPLPDAPSGISTCSTMPPWVPREKKTSLGTLSRALRPPRHRRREPSWKSLAKWSSARSMNDSPTARATGAPARSSSMLFLHISHGPKRVRQIPTWLSPV